MGRYMPQQLFDMCAVSAAKISALSGEPIEFVAEQLANTYQRDYQDENLSQDISAAASNVKTFVIKFLSKKHWQQLSRNFSSVSSTTQVMGKRGGFDWEEP